MSEPHKNNYGINSVSQKGVCQFNAINIVQRPKTYENNKPNHSLNS